MRKRRNLGNNRILTLCIAFAVALAVLTPFVSKVPVFAQEEGVNIEAASNTEQTGQSWLIIRIIMETRKSLKIVSWKCWIAVLA